MPLIHEIDYGTPESSATEQVTLTIDGQDVTVPGGTSIMRAAMEAGIRIPKLCATDMLDDFASCRVCLCARGAGVRGRPEHVRSRHRRPRLRVKGRRRRGREFPDLGMCFLRRLRAG